MYPLALPDTIDNAKMNIIYYPPPGSGPGVDPQGAGTKSPGHPELPKYQTNYPGPPTPKNTTINHVLRPDDDDPHPQSI